MSVLAIDGGAPTLRGEVTPPPDKSIVHRALILSALGTGRSVVEAPGAGADNRSTAHVLQQLGVPVQSRPEGFVVDGVGGPAGLTIPSTPLDCGNSGTTLRLMAGVLAATPGRAVLTGDASLRRRPMARLAPLVEMGARLGRADGAEGAWVPPLRVDGGRLSGRHHRLAVASAQVKSAILLAGLWAEGETEVVEPGPSRDHTERLLAQLGADIEVGAGEGIRLRPLAAPWGPRRYAVAPDMSSAAFLLAAAALTGSAGLRVRTGVNPRRTGFLDALAALGVPVHRAAETEAGGEPIATLHVEGRPQRSAVIQDPVSLRAIDELPLVAVVAAGAPGRTEIRDAGELRVKESDRIARTVALLQAFGVPAGATDDGLWLEGGGPLRPARVEAAGDHRIAMAGAVLGLVAPGRTEVHGAEVIGVSYPDFARVLRGAGAEVG